MLFQRLLLDRIFIRNLRPGILHALFDFLFDSVAQIRLDLLDSGHIILHNHPHGLNLLVMVVLRVHRVVLLLPDVDNLIIDLSQFLLDLALKQLGVIFNGLRSLDELLVDVLDLGPGLDDHDFVLANLVVAAVPAHVHFLLEHLHVLADDLLRALYLYRHLRVQPLDSVEQAVVLHIHCLLLRDVLLNGLLVADHDLLELLGLLVDIEAEEVVVLFHKLPQTHIRFFYQTRQFLLRFLHIRLAQIIDVLSEGVLNSQFILNCFMALFKFVAIAVSGLDTNIKIGELDLK